MANWRHHLEDIYFDPKHRGAFAGPGKLQQVLHAEGYDVGKHRIRQWLQNQDAYSLQKPVQTKFRRNRVVTTGIDELWDTDLADVSNLKVGNDNIHFLLIVIDVLSRYLWVVPLKDNKHGSMVNGFKTIFSSGRKPQKIRSDKGSEYKNKWLN